MNAKTLPFRTGAGDASASARGLARWLPLLAIFAAGVVLRNFVVSNTDVSWLITLCEKALDGERPYVDYIEVNPPASIWLYMVPVWLARVLGMRPEWMVDAFVFAAAITALLLSAAILRQAAIFSRQAMFQLAAVFAALLLLLPAQTFGEREHIALMTFLPFLALAVVRAKGFSPALHFVAAAGLGAGITAVIKPHFAFAMIFVSALAALQVRSWRAFFALENWIAGILLLAYAAAVYFIHPEFITYTLPLVAEIYVPVRAELWRFLLQVATPVLALVLLAIWLLKRRAMMQAPFSLLLAACFGFAISYYVQLKGWSYHAYPMLALAFAAAAIAFGERWPLAQRRDETLTERAKRLFAAFSIAFLAAATFVWMTFAVDMRPIYDVIAKSAPRPSVIGITSDIAVGHPLTRALSGKWVGRVCSQWITAGAKILKAETSDPVQRARYDELEAYDRNLLIEDIRRGKPDIILVEQIGFDWMKWAMSDAVLARELESYFPLAHLHHTLILRRKTSTD